MNLRPKKNWLTWLIVVLLLTGLGFFVWQRLASRTQDEGIVSGNGRIEAEEIDVATKVAGRIKEIKVHEGDLVTAGQVVAVMETQALEAQRLQMEAALRQAEATVITVRSQLAQRESEKAAAKALVVQRQTEVDAARKREARIKELATTGVASQQAADDARAALDSATAALSAARAQVAATEAAISTTRSQVNSAQSAVESAQAGVMRIQVDIDDSTLKAPRDGRVQYLVAHPGEVLSAGGRVLNLVDLSDVYMTFFLPTGVVGGLAIGSEARIVLDAAPQYVLPATVSFVSDVAQFTPKTVETANEREKLMFRVRAQLPPDLLKKHILQVKTGLPGVAYIRRYPTTAWPARLQVKLPQ